MEKYYTPEIEEFHVGFEYESYEKHYRDGDEWDEGTLMWNKRTVCDINQECWNNQEKHRAIYHVHINNHYEKDVNWNKHIRVKYLDKEDIESLGFKSVHDKFPVGGNEHLYLVKYDYKSERSNETDLHILYNKKNNWLLASEEYDGKEDDKKTRFAGFIKNKSEFQKLLKQLNIP